MNEPITLDPERQVKARQYAHIHRRLMLVDLFLGALYLSAWLWLGWSKTLKESLLTITSNDWLLVAGYGFLFAAGYFLLDLPLSYYSGFVLPHQFELSTENIKGWVIDQLKGILVGGILGGLLLEVIYAVLRAAPQTWWLWAAGLLLVFNVLLSNLAPVLLFPIFYKVKPLGEEHQDLVNRLKKLAKGARTQVQGVYQFDMSRRTKQANAALMGLGNTRRIILGDTLLSEFTPDEIETVLAHEFGHHVHKDIPLGIAVGTLMTLGGLYLASLGLNWGVRAMGFENVADIAAFPLFALVSTLYGLVTLPLENAFSRWRERRADRYALEVTRKGTVYASALVRLANQNLADVEPEAWVEFLLYSHPALGKRIRMAQKAAEGVVD
jgi:STE24 endopeptidase